MALDWSLAAQRQLSGDLVRPGVFFRLETAPLVRLWGGDGEYAVTADPVETEDGAVYQGFGQITGLPALSQIANDQAERVSFAISGAALAGELAALAASEAADIRAARVNLGFTLLDADFAPLSGAAIFWFWEGEADSLKVSRSTRATQDGEPEVVYVIALSVGSLFTGRKRPIITLFTDADQKRRSADDRFCERVKFYNAGTTIVWPR